MAATIKEYREILDNEVSVDLKKLVDISAHGIPDKVRGEVWKYLLGVTTSDKTEEIKNARKHKQEYEEIEKSIDAERLKSIRNTLKRQNNWEFLKDQVTQKKIEKILGAYMNFNTDVEYKPDWIHLISPFFFIGLSSENEIFWCFDALMRKRDAYFSEQSVASHISKFQMYFRSLNPSLFNFFEEEELSPNDFVTSWMQSLLAKELPLECLVRLWDTYFSRPDHFHLHIYVCLAILSNLREELQELQEFSELKTSLQHLPQLNMDEIICQAENIKQEIELMM